MPIDRYVVAAQRADRADAHRLAERLRAHRVHNIIEERNFRYVVLVRKSDLDGAHEALHVMDKIYTELPEATRTTRMRSSLLESIGSVFAFAVVIVTISSIGFLAWKLGGSTLGGLAGVGGIALLAMLFIGFQGTGGPVKGGRLAEEHHGPTTQALDNHFGRWMTSRSNWSRSWRIRDWIMPALVTGVIIAIVLDLG